MDKPEYRQSNNEINQRVDNINNNEDESQKQRTRKRRLYTAVFIIVFLFGSLRWISGSARNPSMEGDLAPDFTLVSFEGENLTLSDLRGQVVIINFWASWCIPCRDETPYFQRIWRIYQDKDVVFIGVDIQDTIKEALAFLDEFDVTYFTGPDFDSEIARAYNLKGLPQTVFITKSGEVDSVIIGQVFPPELEGKLDELLAEPDP